MMKRHAPLILGLSLCVLVVPLSAGLAFEGGVLRQSSPGSSAYKDPGPISPLIRIAGPTAVSDGRDLILAQSPVSPGTPLGVEPFDSEPEELSDVLEPVNRFFFQFNDRLYFWFLKPVARGYKAVVPEPARVGVRNFFYNLAFPIRFVNCLLQGKVDGAANELGFFMVNTVFGVGGFLDVLPDEVKLKRQNEDLGQTLGRYGVGPGFYIVWPILGPSTARDSVGMAGDGFLNPLNYLISDVWYNAGIRTYSTVNETSLRIGEYEALKRAAIDPYIALRNAYHQNRLSLIKE
jgi:phospholipid-binding lipoprotein MlaA